MQPNRWRVLRLIQMWPIMPFSFLVKRVSLDAGRDLWNTLFVRTEHFHGSQPALMSSYFGKPGRLVWLFPFKVHRVGRLSTRWTPVSSFHTTLSAYLQTKVCTTYIPVDGGPRKWLHTPVTAKYVLQPF